MKTWQPFDDQCLHCGSGALVLTVSHKPQWVYEDEEAKCSECGCPGSVSIDDGSAGILWHDEAGCSCEWCKKQLEKEVL